MASSRSTGSRSSSSKVMHKHLAEPAVPNPSPPRTPAIVVEESLQHRLAERRALLHLQTRPHADLQDPLKLLRSRRPTCSRCRGRAPADSCRRRGAHRPHGPGRDRPSTARRLCRRIDDSGPPSSRAQMARSLADSACRFTGFSRRRACRSRRSFLRCRSRRASNSGLGGRDGSSIVVIIAQVGGTQAGESARSPRLGTSGTRCSVAPS